MLRNPSSKPHVQILPGLQHPLPQRPRVPHRLATVHSFARRHQQEDRHRTGAIAFGGVYDRVRSLDAELDDLESSADVEVRPGSSDASSSWLLLAVTIYRCTCTLCRDADTATMWRACRPSPIPVSSSPWRRCSRLRPGGELPCVADAACAVRKQLAAVLHGMAPVC